MAPQPPSYGSRDYWDHRFLSNTEAFEWLEAPCALDTYLSDALSHTSEESPEILHIGCGTSSLSSHLTSHVKSPTQVHNLDYSQVAVELGKEKERSIQQHQVDTIGTNAQGPGTTIGYMRWDAVDLLDYRSILQSCKKSTYSVVIDKSTTDSIACSHDVEVPVPYPVSVHPWGVGDSLAGNSHRLIHPLVVLAINLALVSNPGAQWLCLSYSNDRFGLSGWTETLSGFPEPKLLWKEIKRCKIEKATSPVQDEQSVSAFTHRPKIFHWVYVLQRTHVPLYVQEAQG